MLVKTMVADAVAALTGCGATTASSPAASLTPGQALSRADFSKVLAKAVDVDSAHAEITFTSATAKVTEVGEVNYHPLSANLTVDLAGKHVTARLIGGSMYFQTPEGGSGWFKIDLNALGALGMGDLTKIMQSPLSGLKKLAGWTSEVTYVGSSAAGGGTLDHYRAKVDSQALRKGMFPHGLPGGTDAKLPATVTQDMWFDGDGHLVESTVDLGALGTSDTKTSKFGEKVTVVPPPASQVKDLTDTLNNQVPPVSGS